ncbi:ABC transporter substrate-binding protein [Herbaspirillum sp. LeCh32-8]|uniref:ABC transporter substrate-binding protein n=1 Tax=Herbaspirillum sp. LeCh32-8 TaxID=2821356 RepID=UPI001FD7DD83|nr:ABC transporter substrate-binding protein [Herbaspirillum sp. LeCh32-8]
MNRLLAAPTIAMALFATHAYAEKLKVGALFPLSGANAQFGANARNGMELALEDINKNRPADDKVELVFADVPTPNGAAAAVQRLVSQDGVAAIIGSFVSSITLAASEATERLGVPMITHSFADQITGRGYKYIFQVTPKASTFGEKQLGYALDLAKQAGGKIERIAIFYEDTAYGTAQAEGIRKAAAKAGIEVVIDDAYPLGITDVAPLINKLRRSKAQVVFPVSYFNDGILIIRTMKQQRVDLPIVGGAAGYIIPDFQKALGSFAEDVFSIAPANYDTVPDLAARYKAKYGMFMAHESIMYGAALQHVVAAADKVKSHDHAKLRDAIAQLRYCEGLARGIPGGCTAFDASGLSATAYPIFVQWRGADLVTVFPKEAARQTPRWAGKELK